VVLLRPWKAALAEWAVCFWMRASRSSAVRGWRCGPWPSAHAHDAVEDEGEEADQGVGADAVGQAVVDRRDLDVGFQDAEAALDVGQAL
jgi:hypothetical protein